jgi:hypothetical protein
MFRWYANAQESYAYLGDVGGSDTDELMLSFYQSKWFTRGWTLQELLAPHQVYFVQQNWQTILGARNIFPTKYSEAPVVLLDHIFSITEIDAETLVAPFTGKGYHELPGGRFKPTASRAQRMFWASKRQCTHEEDHAYCLLGFFGVNMTLMYGEGREKALARLREEILKSPDEADMLLLGWRPNGAVTLGPRPHKL